MSFFYAVKNGLQPGIYTNWADCKKQVDGFTSAKYKKFPTRAEALEFISGKSIDTAKTSEGAKAAPSSKKRKKDSEDTNQDYYLESSTARQNFYLDSRHANNNFANNNNEKSEPAKKKQCMTSPCASNAASIARSPSIEHLTEYESHQKLEFTFSSKSVCVYTDGACSSNGQKKASAGIGVFWGPDHPLNVSKKLIGAQTNNRAEITAATIAISQAIIYEAGDLTIHTDSKFMINCIENWIANWKKNGWKTSSKQPVKNITDLQLLDTLSAQLKIKWSYVPGHKGVYGNEEADKLARYAIE